MKSDTKRIWGEQVGLHATLATLHPHSARLTPDEDGLMPEWLVFNSMIATARSFLVKVQLFEVD